MSESINLQAEIVALMRRHQEILNNFDSEAIELRKRLAARNFRRIESLGDDTSFLTKANLMRKQFLQVQRFKVRLQKKRVELLLQHAAELKELKLKWSKSR
ncbi:hypothetical protein [Dyadobacter psychrophilus]|uniref:Uncharacterized protein n=1 Tax=Dyadobacter psychrophilus TaxID=651661 RepID=A0A1T5DZY1_9BACT|nr:hypothetical protein [Dyadobacter psychrophilus]SKB77297.1 hypothetical protein SAMN05660293_02049 [Dyadobacter psychrophilus]